RSFSLETRGERSGQGRNSIEGPAVCLPSRCWPLRAAWTNWGCTFERREERGLLQRKFVRPSFTSRYTLACPPLWPRSESRNRRWKKRTKERRVRQRWLPSLPTRLHGEGSHADQRGCWRRIRPYDFRANFAQCG